MKRDWNLIRDILEAFENDEYIAFYDRAGMTDAERSKIYKDDLLKERLARQAVITLHVELLAESGLITRFESAPSPANDCLRLTMAGYDMLDALRDDSVWHRIKDMAVKSGVTISWEFIKQAIPLVYKALL